MFKPDLKADLTATGAIFTLLVCGFMWASSAYHSHAQLTKLQAELQTAKHLVVKLDSENDGLHEALAGLNAAYDSMEDNFYTDIPKLCQLIGVYFDLRDDRIKPKNIKAK